MFQRISAVCGVLTLSMVFFGAPAHAQSDDDVVGQVGDQPVTMADLDEVWQQTDAA